MTTNEKIEQKADELTEIAHKYVYWSHSMKALARHVLAEKIEARIEEQIKYGKPLKPGLERIKELEQQLSEIKQ